VYLRPPPEAEPWYRSWLSEQPKELQAEFAGVAYQDILFRIDGNLYGRRTAGATYRNEFEGIICETLNDEA